MDMLCRLRERYAMYLEEIAQVRRKAPPFAGVLGLGSDPRKHPCNTTFYEDVGSLAAEFVQSQPGGQETLEVVRWLLQAPVGHEKKDAYWYLYAAQGHCRDMIPLLPPEGCQEMLAWYGKQFPRSKRLPVQEEIYRLLAKRAGE